MSYKEPIDRWVIIYGYYGNSTQPLNQLSKELLAKMLADEIDWAWIKDPNER